MQNQHRRHHYIPRFFLKYFSQDQENLWVFDRVKKEYRFQNTKKTALENNFYTHTVKGKKKNQASGIGFNKRMIKSYRHMVRGDN